MKTLPEHLGIILDGNRRWAKERGLPVYEGHKKGLETALRIIEYCQKKGIKILTLFVFSTENWKREKREINWLMKLAEKAFSNHFPHILKNEIRVKIVGDLSFFPKKLQKKILKVEKESEKNKGMVLNLALSYGGRTEILHAVKKIIEKKIPPEKITEETIKKYLWTSDVDLIIRTGREKRLSNFLLWQAAYSELYFCSRFWPDFSEKDLELALISFRQRERRFGK